MTIQTRYAQPVPKPAAAGPTTAPVVPKDGTPGPKGDPGDPGEQGEPGEPGGGGGGGWVTQHINAGEVEFVELDIDTYNNFHIRLVNGAHTDIQLLTDPTVDGQRWRIALQQGSDADSTVGVAFFGARTCFPGGGDFPALSPTPYGIDVFEFQNFFMWNPFNDADYVTLAMVLALDLQPPTP